MQGAIIGGLIAQEQGELAFFFEEGQGGIVHHGVLEALGALAEPVMLGHFEDEDAFGHGFDLMLHRKAVEEVVECVLIFGFEDGEDAGEAETEIVHARGGFSGFGVRASGVLGVGLVGFYLGFCGQGVPFEW